MSFRSRQGFGRVAIFGPGLIGGSIALAIRRHCPGAHLAIWGRDPSRLQEVERFVRPDAVHADPSKAVEGADLVILCTPVGVMTELAAAIAPHLGADTIVTDAGSVKSRVVEELQPFFGDRFLGGHPMAGSERSGLAAARADLFEGAACILTPLPTTPGEILEEVKDFWISLGARVTTMSPADHDRLVARLSHLPHALAFALVSLVTESLPQGSSLLAGGSFRDATRVAASDPVLWTGILSENRVEVVAALREMSALLEKVAGQLEEREFETLLDFFTRARDHRASLPLPSPASTLGTADLIP